MTADGTGADAREMEVKLPDGTWVDADSEEARDHLSATIARSLGFDEDTGNEVARKAAERHAKHERERIRSHMSDVQERLFDVKDRPLAKAIVKLKASGDLPVAKESGYVELPVGEGVDPAKLVAMPLGRKVELRILAEVVKDTTQASKTGQALELVNELEVQRIVVVDADWQPPRKRQDDGR